MFPASDHSSDVIRALDCEMRRLGVKIRLETEVKELMTEKIGEEKRAVGVRLRSGEIVNADAVIVATGGLSYPSTGSTGDGYRFARDCGHHITELSPALAPDGSERMVRQRADGTVSQKYKDPCDRREKEAVRRVR